MIKFLFINIILSVFSITVFSQTWYREEQGNMCGYVDSSGKIKIPFEYPDVFTYEFTDSVAFVVILENKTGKIKVIDRNNKKLFTVYSPEDIGEELFRIVNEDTGDIGFADMNGNVIITPRFFYVDLFSKGLAAFNVGGRLEPMDKEHTLVIGGKWGYIDKTGKEIFPAIFDKAYPFENNEAKVRIGENIFFIKKCNHK